MTQLSQVKEGPEHKGGINPRPQYPKPTVKPEQIRQGPKPGLKKPHSVKPAKQLPTRSLADFPKLKGLQPTLTVIKVHHPKKHHRLIWQFMGRDVWCKENQIAYTKVHGKGGVIEAGETLAKLLGVRFKP